MEDGIDSFPFSNSTESSELKSPAGGNGELQGRSGIDPVSGPWDSEAETADAINSSVSSVEEKKVVRRELSETQAFAGHAHFQDAQSSVTSSLASSVEDLKGYEDEAPEAASGWKSDARPSGWLVDMKGDSGSTPHSNYTKHDMRHVVYAVTSRKCINKKKLHAYFTKFGQCHPYVLPIPSIDDPNDRKLYPEQSRYILYYMHRVAAEKCCAVPKVRLDPAEVVFFHSPIVREAPRNKEIKHSIFQLFYVLGSELLRKSFFLSNFWHEILRVTNSEHYQFKEYFDYSGRKHFKCWYPIRPMDEWIEIKSVGARIALQLHQLLRQTPDTPLSIPYCIEVLQVTELEIIDIVQKEHHGFTVSSPANSEDILIKKNNAVFDRFGLYFTNEVLAAAMNEKKEIREMQQKSEQRESAVFIKLYDDYVNSRTDGSTLVSQDTTKEDGTDTDTPTTIARRPNNNYNNSYSYDVQKRGATSPTTSSQTNRPSPTPNANANRNPPSTTANANPRAYVSGQTRIPSNSDAPILISSDSHEEPKRASNATRSQSAQGTASSQQKGHTSRSTKSRYDRDSSSSEEARREAARRRAQESSQSHSRSHRSRRDSTSSESSDERDTRRSQNVRNERNVRIDRNNRSERSERSERSDRESRSRGASSSRNERRYRGRDSSSDSDERYRQGTKSKPTSRPPSRQYSREPSRDTRSRDDRSRSRYSSSDSDSGEDRYRRRNDRSHGRDARDRGRRDGYSREDRDDRKATSSGRQDYHYERSRESVREDSIADSISQQDVPRRYMEPVRTATAFSPTQSRSNVLRKSSRGEAEKSLPTPSQAVVVKTKKTDKPQPKRSGDGDSDSTDRVDSSLSSSHMSQKKRAQKPIDPTEMSELSTVYTNSYTSYVRGINSSGPKIIRAIRKEKARDTETESEVGVGQSSSSKPSCVAMDGKRYPFRVQVKQPQPENQQERYEPRHESKHEQHKQARFELTRDDEDDTTTDDRISSSHSTSQHLPYEDTARAMSKLGGGGGRGRPLDRERDAREGRQALGTTGSGRGKMMDHELMMRFGDERKASEARKFEDRRKFDEDYEAQVIDEAEETEDLHVRSKYRREDERPSQGRKNDSRFDERRIDDEDRRRSDDSRRTQEADMWRRKEDDRRKNRGS